MEGAAHRSGPLLWVLHLGYGWLVVALILKAAALPSGATIAGKWLHAFTVGTVGTMTLAVMSRAALGHSGRPLAAPWPMPLAYLAISGAAIARVFGPPLSPDGYDQVIAGAGCLWITAFAIYLWIYAPILLLPRHDGKLG
ncbi:MAG: NnrS family protein [Alphaproteobacteria bacterium]|nr:NnrS family protein [Alphaproteobacteria bacterium]